MSMFDILTDRITVEWRNYGIILAEKEYHALQWNKYLYFTIVGAHERSKSQVEMENSNLGETHIIVPLNADVVLVYKV